MRRNISSAESSGVICAFILSAAVFVITLNVPLVRARSFGSDEQDDYSVPPLSLPELVRGGRFLAAHVAAMHVAQHPPPPTPAAPVIPEARAINYREQVYHMVHGSRHQR